MKGTMQDFPLTLDMIFRRFSTFGRGRAIVTGGPGANRSSWGEISDNVLKLCNALKRLGLKDFDRVATFAWNSNRHLEVYYAAPLCRAVLHTLNIRLFAEQLVYIANHAEDRFVFVDASLTKLLAPHKDQLKTVEHFIVMPDGAPVDPAFADALNYEELIAAESADFSLPKLEESDAAGMCYTSGTTGNPKGVVYTHRSNVLHSFGVMARDCLGICEADMVLPVVPMFHANAWGLPYACGFACAGITFPGADMTPQNIANLMQAEKVTLAAGVPTIWLGMEPIVSAGTHDFSSVRSVVCGGSAVPEGLIRRYAAKGLQFWQAWGMTETSPVGSGHKIPSAVAESITEDERFGIMATAGVPIAGVELRITDDEGNEQPWDATSVGEIEVRGPWVTAGYYNPDDDANTVKFRDGWLRTGDVATVDQHGIIRITDRTKDLVKSGGEWISSVELESRLMAHPAVAEATVIGVPHPKWDERPLALVVKREGHEVTPEELIEFLRPQVAKWWLPDAVEFIDAVPKTSVGKFDKKVVREKYKNYQLPTIG